MHESFEPKSRSYLGRDGARVRQVSHRQQPIVVEAASPRAAAAEYLDRQGHLLGLGAAELGATGLRPIGEVGEAPDEAGLEYRFHEEKAFFDLTTVAFQQTYHGLPVWRSGLAVYVKAPAGPATGTGRRGHRIVGATSTAADDVEPNRPIKKELERWRKLSGKTLSRLLGLGDDHGTPEIRRIRPVVYRHDAEERLPSDHDHGDDGQGDGGDARRIFPAAHPTLPLPPVADPVRDGTDRVAIEVIFALSHERRNRLVWRAIVDVATGSVLYLRALVDNDGLVFLADPFSAGNPALDPSSTGAALDPLRTSVPLAIDPAVGGNESLVGDWIEIQDFELATAAPPTVAAGTDFDYGSRTDDFAAVNAYYHCHEFFALVEDLGFPIATYFDGTTFPLPVDHRGRFGSLDGIEVNASCSGNGLGGIDNCDYELADLSDTANPLGIATDRRVVLHELGGHGVLYDHVNAANFGFAHSAGDSFAAILADPLSTAADRFLTFPWLITSRRHDRDVAAGWGWDGASDTGGYNSEQILATTHFRIYRSLGGDSGNLATRERAARVTAYLILQGIGTLTEPTNPAHASDFANALLAADLVDWTSEGWIGGAYGKVIRWAFEKQGLYQPAGAPTPVTTEGDPPAVDVYIDDGRAGEYEYLANHWSCQAIWNRLAADGGTAHEPPVVGVTNYAYVKIKNRGTQLATGVTVEGYHCQPGAGLTWPDDWQPMATPVLAAPDVAANDAAEVTVGPFEWVPSQIDHECMLMIVRATGDASNVDLFAAGETIPEWRLVPHDNNIGQRNVSPVAGGGGGRGLLSSFPRRFVVRNPADGRAGIELVTTLPPVLEERGWKVRFANPGGATFRLAPGQSREVRLDLVPGGDFRPADVAADDGATIDVAATADGQVIGGMSYQLDPKLEKAPPRRPAGNGKGKGRKAGRCRRAAERLLDCLDLPEGRVKRACVRKVVVEIELDDCDCDG